MLIECASTFGTRLAEFEAHRFRHKDQPMPEHHPSSPLRAVIKPKSTGVNITEGGVSHLQQKKNAWNPSLMIAIRKLKLPARFLARARPAVPRKKFDPLAFFFIEYCFDVWCAPATVADADRTALSAIAPERIFPIRSLSCRCLERPGPADHRSSQAVSATADGLVCRAGSQAFHV